MPSSSSKKKRASKQQQRDSQGVTPRLSVPSLTTKAAAAAPATTSAVAGTDARLAADRSLDASPVLGTGSSSGGSVYRFPTSASASTIGSSHLNVAGSLSQLIAQERDPRTRTSSNASSVRTSTAAGITASPAQHRLSTSAGLSASPAPTHLSVSPPSPHKHGDVSLHSPGAGADSRNLPSSTMVEPSLITPPSTSSGGSGAGALKSLQRVASRDRLQKEQVDQAAAKKAAKKSKGKSSKKAKEAPDEAESTGSQAAKEAVHLAAAAPAHNESVEHQESAHAEADRIIEADRLEADQLTAHVVQHQGDLKPKTPADTRQTADLSAAFQPTYELRKPRTRTSIRAKAAKQTSAEEDEAASEGVSFPQPDPEEAQRVRRGWHAQLEADRQRVGAAIGDMVVRGSANDQQGRSQAAGWRHWRRTDRSAEVGSVFQSGTAGPQMGLVWHGPGLGLPEKLNAGISAGRSAFRRLLGGKDASASAETMQDDDQRKPAPGPMQLVGMRSPLPLLVPHSIVEWTTAALGAGIGVQVFRWALGGDT